VTLGQITKEVIHSTQAKTIRHIVLKLQSDRARFQSGEASINFSVGECLRRNRTND